MNYTTGTMALLDICHVSRSFGEIKAVDDVCLSIESGEFFTLVGPSGCGKTTLLRLIAGFDELDAGELLLDAQNVAFRCRWLAGTPRRSVAASRKLWTSCT